MRADLVQTRPVWQPIALWPCVGAHCGMMTGCSVAFSRTKFHDKEEVKMSPQWGVRSPRKEITWQTSGSHRSGTHMPDADITDRRLILQSRRD